MNLQKGAVVVQVGSNRSIAIIPTPLIPEVFTSSLCQSDTEVARAWTKFFLRLQLSKSPRQDASGCVSWKILEDAVLQFKKTLFQSLM